MSRHITVYHGSTEAVEAFFNRPTFFTPSFSKAVWYARRLAALRPVVYKCRLFVRDFDLRKSTARQHYSMFSRAMPKYNMPDLGNQGFLKPSGLPCKSHLPTLMPLLSHEDMFYNSAWLDDGDESLVVFNPIDNCILLTEDVLK
jgi:hypothetical protein